MKRKWLLVLAVALTIGSLGFFLSNSRSARAQGGGRILARSQFRSTIDPSQFEPPAPHSAPASAGTLLLTDNGEQQLFNAQIKNLNIENLSVQVDTNSFFDGTNSPTYFVALLNRNGAKLGNWSRKLTGTNGAPPEFQFIGIDNLSDLSDVRCIVVGSPGVTNVVGGTNIINCTVTIISNVAVTVCTTNIGGGITNIFLNAYLWAPVPPLAASPSDFNFKEKVTMQQPSAFPPPSPKAKGKISFTYNGSQGGSVLDVEVSGLIQGQGYSLGVSNFGTNVSSGAFVLKNGGSSGRYHRDTKRGDPLPLQVASTADLTNRIFTVLDSFGIVHLVWVPSP